MPGRTTAPATCTTSSVALPAPARRVPRSPSAAGADAPVAPSEDRSPEVRGPDDDESVDRRVVADAGAPTGSSEASTPMRYQRSPATSAVTSRATTPTRGSPRSRSTSARPGARPRAVRSRPQNSNAVTGSDVGASGRSGDGGRVDHGSSGRGSGSGTDTVDLLGARQRQEEVPGEVGEDATGRRGRRKGPGPPPRTGSPGRRRGARARAPPAQVVAEVRAEEPEHPALAPLAHVHHLVREQLPVALVAAPQEHPPAEGHPRGSGREPRHHEHAGPRPVQTAGRARTRRAPRASGAVPPPRSNRSRS